MRGFIFAILAILLLGVVGGIGYQMGVAATATATATAPAVTAYPWVWHPFSFFGFFGFLFPLLFLFLIFGLMRAAFGGWRGSGYYGHWGRSRMFDEWHRDAHDHPERHQSDSGKAES